MAEKISLEELMSKRIRLSPEEYNEMMFHLRTCAEFYEILKRNNPKYDEDVHEYEDELREVDYLDFGRFVTWGRTMMANCNKIVRKAHAGKNVVGEQKDNPQILYSKEEGLCERWLDGTTITKADPYELML